MSFFFRNRSFIASGGFLFIIYNVKRIKRYSSRDLQALEDDVRRQTEREKALQKQFADLRLQLEE